MNTFALDKNYSQLNFEEISIDELEIISGGTGLANVNDGISTNYYSTNRGWSFTVSYPGGSTTTANPNTQWYSYTYINGSGQVTTGTGSTYG